jgi:hypothetical protein
VKKQRKYIFVKNVRMLKPCGSNKENKNEAERERVYCREAGKYTQC